MISSFINQLECRKRGRGRL